MPLVDLAVVAFGLFGVFAMLRSSRREADLMRRERDIERREKSIELPIDDFINAIEAANPNRDISTMVRRVAKVSEELGELSEAYLNVTSAANAKNKTWGDVREEAIDTAIVAIDVALTPHPTETLSAEEIKSDAQMILRRKLAKWANNRSTATAATQQADDAV